MRKAKLKDIKVNDKVFEKIFSDSPFGIALISADFHFFKVNQAFCDFIGYKEDELWGMTINDITDPENFADEKNSLQLLINGLIPVYKTEKKYLPKGGGFRWGSVSISPIKDEKGEFAHLLAIIEDITDKRIAEEFQQFNTELTRMQLSLYRQSQNLSEKELFDMALDFAVKMTQSEIGFFHQVHDDQEHVILTTWNTEALKNCTAVFDDHYPISQAGNWVDCVKEKKTVIYNDFKNSPNQKGLPEGHSHVTRFMSIPVIIDQKVKLIFGVGNKSIDYNAEDVTRVLLVAEELTKILERKRIEEDIKKRKQYLRAVLNATTESVFLIDNEGNLLAGNDTFAKRAGCNTRDLVGQNLFELLPENFSIMRKAKLQEVIESKKSLTFIDQRNDRILENNLYPIINNEEVTAIAIFSDDITDQFKVQEILKESQALYHDLVETSMNLIFQCDSEGRYTFLNQEWEEVFGYKVEEMLGKRFFDFIAPEYEERDLNEFKRLLKGNFVKGFETVHVNKSGNHVDLLFNANFIKNNEGRIIGTRGSGVDITHLKKYQAEIIRINEELKDMNLAKDKFYSIIAHDLRGQFNGLLGFSGILADPGRDLAPEEVKKLSSKLHSLLTSQFHLLQNLLDWARIQLGKAQINHEKVNVSSEIDNILHLVLGQLVRKNIELINKVHESFFATADPIMLQSVLQNVLMNAIKFTPAGGMITITAKEEGKNLEIRIEDTGIGISEENLEKIAKGEGLFSSKGTDGEKGTGLGLMLIREMMDKQGGVFSIHSKLNQGTTVLLTLPKA